MFDNHPVFLVLCMSCQAFFVSWGPTKKKYNVFYGAAKYTLFGNLVSIFSIIIDVMECCCRRTNQPT